MAALVALLGLVPACAAAPPVSAAAPDPQRPVVDLSFDVSPDLHAAHGTEHVVFTPDQQVCQLLFRDWPNKPTAAKGGTSLVVTDAAVDGTPVTARVEDAGAPPDRPGTLVELPLPRCLPAGAVIHSQLRFRLILGLDADERYGYSPSTRTAWFGGGFPLFAWVRGEGWTRDPAVDLDGETATSEEFRLNSLSVTSDDDQAVIGTGAATGTSRSGPGRTTHHFIADSVRDVNVAVGNYDLFERSFGNVRVHVATPRVGSRASAIKWAKQIGKQLTNLQKLLGPYPYADIWATIVPTQTDGVEFPTSIQFGDKSRPELPSLVAHELAHQWFYSLVGNNQARDPWLDESFATFAQAIAAHQQNEYRLADEPDRYVGELGAPMSFWAGRGDFNQYVRGVYDQGAAVLLAARDQVGSSRFDAALRSYLAANAHRVATPAALANAFRDLPPVIDLLRRHGAFVDQN